MEIKRLTPSTIKASGLALKKVAKCWEKTTMRRARMVVMGKTDFRMK